MSKKNVYVVGAQSDQTRVNDLICRLTWYFTPFLDGIDRIEIAIESELIAAARVEGPLDPLIESHLPALKDKLVPATEGEIRGRLKRVDGRKHLFLLADEALEEEYRAEIGRFRPHGRFYRVDPEKTRMEGSFYLWAGINGFVDQKHELAVYRERFRQMHEEIGSYEKAYVFGTGPSLGDFVEDHDFDDGLCIIANSIVKNDELLTRLKPRIIVAADPIFHAGCSSYAAAFRTELAAAMEKTGAWFLCPLRDVKIYATYLPERFHDRIIGIGFNDKAPPPSDLTERFELKPYPNILTLMLLPVAATFARSIHIAGCDGRRITDDGAFWTHDKSAQFNDEMDNIKRVHPGFFAIDYNDYYLDHARDLETVLATLEQAGRTCVNECRSYVPALYHRERPGLRGEIEMADRPFAPRTIAILDPDARGDWGHFLAYDRRMSIAAEARGLDFAIVGREELSPELRPESTRSLVNVYSQHSWTVGNKWPRVETRHLSTFAAETGRALDRLEDEHPDEDILLFMYCGSVEIVEMLEHILIYHPRVRAVINLFWSYNFDITQPAYRARYLPGLRRVLSRPGRVRVMHSTPQIAAEFRREAGLEIPVLPHPSTTFSDGEAGALAERPPRTRPEGPARILFPGGARPEKGYLLAAETCQRLSGDDRVRLLLRARLDPTVPPELRAAVEALDPELVELVEGDFPQDEFVDWLASADVLVVPYLPEAFSNRTSGMLVDAMLLGIPVVVVEGTWLADEVAASGAGLSVAPTPEAMAEGITQVLETYETYAAATRSAAGYYTQASNWTVLVDRVLDTAGAPALMARPPVRTAGEEVPVRPLRLLTRGGGRAGAVVRAAQLADVLDRDEGGDPACLVYPDAHRLVAEAILTGCDPEASLAAWRAETDRMLGVYRQNRRRLILVAQEGLRAAPEEYGAFLQGYGFVVEPDILTPAVEIDPLVRLLADVVVRGDPAAVALSEELDASSMAPSGAAPGRAPALDAAGAFARLRDLLGFESTAIRLDMLNDVLATTRAERQAAEQRVAGLRAELEQAAEASALQTQQLAQLQATVEMYFRETAGLRRDLLDQQLRAADAEAALREFRGELDRVYASKSWRVTGPLRSFRRRLHSDMQAE